MYNQMKHIGFQYNYEANDVNYKYTSIL